MGLHGNLKMFFVDYWVECTCTIICYALSYKKFLNNKFAIPHGLDDDFSVKDHDLLATESYAILGLKPLIQWVLFAPVPNNAGSSSS